MHSFASLGKIIILWLKKPARNMQLQMAAPTQKTITSWLSRNVGLNFASFVRWTGEISLEEKQARHFHLSSQTRRKKMRPENLFLVSFSLIFLVSWVTCQEEEDDTQETTTDPYIDSTTTEAPRLGLEQLDYRFTSLTSGFVIDVNFTEIEGDSENTIMSMKVSTTDPTSYFAKTVCDQTAAIIAIRGDECPPGIASLTFVEGDVIARIQKTG